MKHKTETFETMVNNYINGNLFDFRAALKRLNKSDLLRFCAYCYHDAEETGLDVFEIHKQFIM